jgi:hypothetical protein
MMNGATQANRAEMGTPDEIAARPHFIVEATKPAFVTGTAYLFDRRRIGRADHKVGGAEKGERSRRS